MLREVRKLSPRDARARSVLLLDHADGGSGGSGSVRIGFLIGDVNGSRTVTLSDRVLVLNEGRQFAFGTPSEVFAHGEGLLTSYSHMSRMVAQVGSFVRRGELIGYVGSSGLSTGPHLHYQIDLFGSHVNPLWYFQDNLTEDEYFLMLDYLSKP